MLVIRKEQQEKLSKYMADSFEDKLLVHFKEFFPIHYKMLGKETMQNTIHHGAQAAAAYDVTSQREVSYYISMMLMFGSSFDRDPQLPWAAELLNDRSLDHHPDRVGLVYQRALKYLDKVAGPENIFVIQALERAVKLSLNLLVPPARDSFEKGIYSQLEELYPQKFLALDGQCIDTLIVHGRKVAQDYALADENAETLVILMMFFLGSGFHEDPQLPWVALVLNDKEARSAEERVASLFDETMSQLKKWVK